MPPLRTRSRRVLLLAAFALLASAAAGQAQPFSSWLTHAGSGTGRIEIPHHPSLNPTAAFTFEAWVAIAAGGGCRSIAGKDFTQTWWIGVCGTTLRSYLKGGSSPRDGGVVPAGQWTHVAVVFDGSRRLHYVDGELVGDFPETGPLPTNSAPMRIASDVSWDLPPAGGIDEVRLWEVARTTEEIRNNLNERVGTPRPGLVAVWPLDGTADDVIGARDGSWTGPGLGVGTLPVSGACAGSATRLCLFDRFLIGARFRSGPPGSPEGVAQVAPCSNESSGVFWFANADSWEVMVKALDGCGVNDRWWIFSTANTDVFHRLEVLDVTAGEQKVYFHYPGPPVPTVYDTHALATCP